MGGEEPNATMNRQGLRIWSGVNLVFLVAFASLLSLRETSVQTSLLPDLLICLVFSLSYPFWLPWIRSSPRFWRCMLHYLSILTVAQVFSFLVYLVWFGMQQIPPFRRSALIFLTQENTTLSAAVFVWETVASLVVGVICYAIGYLACRCCTGIPSTGCFLRRQLLNRCDSSPPMRS